MHRSHKHQKGLPHRQKRRNEQDKRRKLVEKVFGTRSAATGTASALPGQRNAGRCGSYLGKMCPKT